MFWSGFLILECGDVVGDLQGLSFASPSVSARLLVQDKEAQFVSIRCLDRDEQWAALEFEFVRFGICGDFVPAAAGSFDVFEVRVWPGLCAGYGVSAQQALLAAAVVANVFGGNVCVAHALEVGVVEVFECCFRFDFLQGEDVGIDGSYGFGEFLAAFV